MAVTVTVAVVEVVAVGVAVAVAVSLAVVVVSMSRSRSRSSSRSRSRSRSRCMSRSRSMSRYSSIYVFLSYLLINYSIKILEIVIIYHVILSILKFVYQKSKYIILIIDFKFIKYVPCKSRKSFHYIWK